MGLVVLHYRHGSKIFRRLVGTQLQPGVEGKHQQQDSLERGSGAPNYGGHGGQPYPGPEEMYGEFFDVPTRTPWFSSVGSPRRKIPQRNLLPAPCRKNLLLPPWPPNMPDLPRQGAPAHYRQRVPLGFASPQSGTSLWKPSTADAPFLNQSGATTPTPGQQKQRRDQLFSQE